MTIQEAKLILQGYRPNGADAGDPVFSEALRLAENDPALRDWFAGEQAFDHGISTDFGSTQVPSGLREGILAEARAAGLAPSRPRSWRLPLGLAAAACVALLLSLSLARWRQPHQLATNSALAEFAIADAQDPRTHGGHGEETAALNLTLKQPTTRLGDQLPVDFATLRRTGCRTVNVDGHEVLEVCFKRNGVGLHCYIARCEDFPALTAAKTPTLADKTGASIAVWSDAANFYVVVSKPGREALEKLL